MMYSPVKHAHQFVAEYIETWKSYSVFKKQILMEISDVFTEQKF